MREEFKALAQRAEKLGWTQLTEGHPTDKDGFLCEQTCLLGLPPEERELGEQNLFAMDWYLTVVPNNL